MAYSYVVSRTSDNGPSYIVTITSKNPIPALKELLTEREDWVDSSLEKTYENVVNLLRDEINVEPIMVSVQRPECVSPSVWWYEGLYEDASVTGNGSESVEGSSEEEKTEKKRPTVIPGLF